MGFQYPHGNSEFEFQRMKVLSGLQFEKVFYTLLPKIVCRRVICFQLEKCRLVYWINVRKWPKYTFPSQQFWKLTNIGLKCCNFKMHVTDCLSITKHWLWRTSKEPCSSLLWFVVLCCYNFFCNLPAKV